MKESDGGGERVGGSKKVIKKFKDPTALAKEKKEGYYPPPPPYSIHEMRGRIDRGSPKVLTLNRTLIKAAAAVAVATGDDDDEDDENDNAEKWQRVFASFVAEIRRITNKYCPLFVPYLDVNLNTKFRGREVMLYDIIRSLGSEEGVKREIHSFYMKYNKAKLSELPTLFKQNRIAEGGLAMMYRKVVIKYAAFDDFSVLSFAASDVNQSDSGAGAGTGTGGLVCTSALSRYSTASASSSSSVALLGVGEGVKFSVASVSRLGAGDGGVAKSVGKGAGLPPPPSPHPFPASSFAFVTSSSLSSASNSTSSTVTTDSSDSAFTFSLPPSASLVIKPTWAVDYYDPEQTG